MITAHLVETIPTSAGVLQGGLLVERSDASVRVRDLRSGVVTRFPAPWPRDFGSMTVSPGGDVAVFSGVHAVQAVDATGAVRWEVRHGCWSAAVCTERHTSYSEYADDHHHTHADEGSAAYSADGALLWAHVRNFDGGEEWLILDSADGTELGRYATDTVGSSFHTPHPDPAYMGLSVGEGHEESPAFWGYWDGERPIVQRLDEEVLLAASPSGEHLLATDPGQWSLYLRRAADGTELGRLDAENAVPAAPDSDGDRPCWEFDATFPFDDTAVVSTEDGPRHWLIDVPTLAVRAQVAYPFAVAGPPRPAGPGRWYTDAEDGTAIHLWTVVRQARTARR